MLSFIFLSYAYAPVIFLYKFCVYVNFLQSYFKLVLLNKVELPFVKCVTVFSTGSFRTATILVI